MFWKVVLERVLCAALESGHGLRCSVEIRPKSFVSGGFKHNHVQNSRKGPRIVILQNKSYFYAVLEWAPGVETLCDTKNNI